MIEKRAIYIEPSNWDEKQRYSRGFYTVFGPGSRVLCRLTRVYGGHTDRFEVECGDLPEHAARELQHRYAQDGIDTNGRWHFPI